MSALEEMYGISAAQSLRLPLYWIAVVSSFKDM